MKRVIVFGLLCTLALVGCEQHVHLGGNTESIRVVVVEPGDVVEIASEDPLEIVVPATKDKPAGLSKHKLAGFVAMPKSVYRELRKKAYPDEGVTQK